MTTNDSATMTTPATTSKSEARFDSLFEVIGQIGRFQLWYYLVLCLPVIVIGMQAYSNNILITPPPGNQSCDCESLNRSIGNGGANETLTATDCFFSEADSAVSVVAAFRLVCNREFLLRFPNIAVYLGMFVGSFIFGQTSDWFGRRLTIWISTSVMILTGALLAAPMDQRFGAFLFLRFVLGACLCGCYVTSFVMGVELVGPKYRLFAGLVINIFFAFGPLIAGAIAAVVEDWRHLALALSLPGIIFLPLTFCLPESPRWLSGKERTKELKRTLVSAAKMNRKLSGEWRRHELESLVDTVVQNEKKDDGGERKQAYVHDLFRGRQMRLKTLVILFNWMVVSGVYYGVTLNTARLKVSPMLGLIVSGAVELVSYFALFPVLNSVGRRVTYASSMMISGILCFSCIFTTGDAAAFSLSMIGKFFISAAFAIIFIYAAELFPTVLRNTGMGVSSLVARIGSMSAPVLVDFSPDGTTPLVVFGCLAGVAGFLALTLPETTGRPLPATLPEAEKMRIQNPLRICSHRKRESGEGDREISAADEKPVI